MVLITSPACPCQVCEKPLMYLVDTPGVLPPRLGDVETGMKLALCGEAGVTLLLTPPACEGVEGGLARARQG